MEQVEGDHPPSRECGEYLFIQGEPSRRHSIHSSWRPEMNHRFTPLLLMLPLTELGQNLGVTHNGRFALGRTWELSVEQ